MCKKSVLTDEEIEERRDTIRTNIQSEQQRIVDILNNADIDTSRVRLSGTDDSNSHTPSRRLFISRNSSANHYQSVQQENNQSPPSAYRPPEPFDNHQTSPKDMGDI